MDYCIVLRADFREELEAEAPNEFFLRLNRLDSLGMRAKDEDLTIVLVFFKRLMI